MTGPRLSCVSQWFVKINVFLRKERSERIASATQMRWLASDLSRIGVFAENIPGELAS